MSTFSNTTSKRNSLDPLANKVNTQRIYNSGLQVSVSQASTSKMAISKQPLSLVLTKKDSKTVNMLRKENKDMRR